MSDSETIACGKCGYEITAESTLRPARVVVREEALSKGWDVGSAMPGTGAAIGARCPKCRRRRWR